MLDALDESLEAFLRATVPLDAQAVDVAFEPPERQWSAKLNRPTVNVFLWDITRSSDAARAGVETIERDGVKVRRMPLPRVELQYLLTAWTSDHGDERALLSGLLRAALAHQEIPPAFVAEPLQPLTPLTLSMPRRSDRNLEVFQALDGQLKPGIGLTVVAPVDVGVVTPTGPPVTGVELTVAERRPGADGHRRASTQRRVAGEVRDAAAVGAVVRSPHGKTTVNLAGRFLIAAQPGDEVVIDTDPPRTVVVPDVGGVVVG